jgi:hypothetical protein
MLLRACAACEPANKLFVNNPANVIDGLAVAQSRQDRSCLCLLLIWVYFKVDADGIVLKQQRRDSVEQLAVLPPKSAFFF